MDAREFAQLPDPFRMWRGGILHGGRIAYETWGKLNAARDNALLLFTGLSPPAHAASSDRDPSEGWWQGMVGPKLALDTERPDVGRHRDERDKGRQHQAEEIDRYVLENAFVHRLPSVVTLRR